MNFLSLTGPRGRLSFLAAFFCYNALFIGVLQLFAVMLDAHRNVLGLIGLIVLVTSIVVMYKLAAQRLSDMGKSAGLGLLIFVPFLGVLFMLYLALAPSRRTIP